MYFLYYHFLLFYIQQLYHKHFFLSQYDNNDISNFAFNYVDDITNKLIVGLINNSKEEQ